jgi:hypothetical protein
LLSDITLSWHCNAVSQPSVTEAFSFIEWLQVNENPQEKKLTRLLKSNTSPQIPCGIPLAKYNNYT